MIYTSFRTRRELVSDAEIPFGAAHYSYRIVYERFRKLFELNATPFKQLSRPESSPNIRAKATNAGADPIHFIVKPFEEIRILKGANNICHVAWEFDKIPTIGDWAVGHPLREKPFADMGRMLRLVDKVLVGSNFALEVFRRYGIESVEFVPAPIPVSQGDPMQAMLNRQNDYEMQLTELDGLSARVFDPISGHRVPLRTLFGDTKQKFLTVATPGDIRKNLPAMLEGFARFSEKYPSLLLIKCTIDNSSITIGDVLSREFPARWAELELNYPESFSPNIFLIHDAMSSAQMKALYGLANFYVCTSFAEGQNLPLQEAMAQGLVPISTRNTAMLDYLKEENSISIDSREIEVPFRVPLAYGIENTRWNSCEASDVFAALNLAAGLSDVTMTAKGVNAIQSIQQGYSFERVTELINKAFE